ncbi:DUF7848 domain-containing protein [Streptomyces fuscichromogenes]|uniref:DUF7848 domain-containing protein n=1 Tax=Streptomyces fuscichromogenes TaxID=1324013 RepID=A0A918CUP9_9ACTN|nr:hypothetical protein GCM10011578_064630 [Streptomyces fuscichromogenes]
MTSRTIMRHQEWTLQPDREPDAEPTTYAMQCAVCGETSPPGTDFAEPQSWVFTHCAWTSASPPCSTTVPATRAGRAWTTPLSAPTRAWGSGAVRSADRAHPTQRFDARWLRC